MHIHYLRKTDDTNIKGKGAFTAIFDQGVCGSILYGYSIFMNEEER